MIKIANRIKDSLDSVKELSVIYVIMVSVVATLFAFFEGRDLLTSVWWTFITGLTIGYGDVYPITIAGKILAVLWAHIMVFIYIPVAVGYVVVNMIKNKDAWTDDEQREMMEIMHRLDGKRKSDYILSPEVKQLENNASYNALEYACEEIRGNGDHQGLVNIRKEQAKLKPKRCIWGAKSSNASFSCDELAGHGKHGEYCKNHVPDYEKDRNKL